jgi:uncharacterized membrane protein
VSESRATAPRHQMDPIERMVAHVLGAGIAISLALMLAGVALSIARGEGLPLHVVRLGDLASQLVALEPAAYLSLGLVTLIATPFVRVAGSLVAFARERDRRYVLVTAVVLAVMCVSVLLGRA